MPKKSRAVAWKTDETLTDNIIAGIERNYPSGVIGREVVGEATGNAISPRTMANLDSRGEGPEESFYIGRKKCYTVDSFCTWLRGRISPVFIGARYDCGAEHKGKVSINTMGEIK